MARVGTGGVPQHANTRNRALEAINAGKRRRSTPPDVDLARNHIAKRIKDDIGWWYNQAKRMVEHPNGRQDENSARIVLKVLDKLLPDKRELIKTDETEHKPPIAIIIGGGISRQPQQANVVDVTYEQVEDVSTPGKETA